MFVSCHFYGNKSQVQKVMLVGYDWWISICLCLLSMSKVGRQKIAAMHVTLNAAIL